MRPCLLSFKLTFKYQVSSIRYYPGILNIAVLKTYGSIYTFSSLLNLLFVHHVKDRFSVSEMVENNGFEPLTLCVQGRCSSQLS